MTKHSWGPAALVAGLFTFAQVGLAGAAAPHRYVLVVAHNQSNDAGVKALRFADDDGVRYFEFFRLSTDRVALLLQAPPC